MDRGEIIAVAAVGSLLTLVSLLTYMAVLALDMEIKQNNRDLESFRSQGFPLSPLSSQGEGSIEQSAHNNNQ